MLTNKLEEAGLKGTQLSPLEELEAQLNWADSAISQIATTSAIRTFQKQTAKPDSE